jgi:hypothetical protein
MIADLDETLRRLLVAELPVKNGEIEISFDQPKREWSARLTRPTVNLFLYDLRENPVLRQHQWDQLPRTPAGGNGDGGRMAHLKRTPYRVDCLYMLTTWAAEPEDEHRLLTRSLLAFFRFPILPADRLVGSLAGQPFPLQTHLASHDRLTNPAEIWSSLDNEIRPSISYIITIALDPWTEISEPIVRTLTLRTGQAEGLPRQTRLAEGTASELVDVGGYVRDASGKGAPRAGVQVAVKGTGLFATSDDQGRFILGSLPPGEYTLVAWPEAGGPLQRKVSLPGKTGDCDFEL